MQPETRQTSIIDEGLSQARVSPHRKPVVAVLLAATLLALPYVVLTAFTGFAPFDDEGTLMIGFRSVLDGHRMYDEVYSLYGPLYNAVYSLIYVVLGVPLTHTAARSVAACLWLAYTAGFALIAWRLTRSLIVLAASYLLALLWLAGLMLTAGHPEELCLVMLTAVLLLGSFIHERPSPAPMFGLGCLIAGLALVKINIGVYVGAGVVLVLLRVTTRSAFTRLAVPAVAAGLLLLPLLVMALLFELPWVQRYSAFATLSIGTALLVCFSTPLAPRLSGRSWWPMVAGAGLTILLVVGGTMAAGSSAHGILNAVLLQNAHFVKSWYIALPLSVRGIPTAVLSAIAAALYVWSGSRPMAARYRTLGIIALKSGYILVGLSLSRYPGPVFSALVPFCWLIMVPPAASAPNVPVMRSLAGVVAATLSLYPFPVGGGQVDIAAALPVVFMPVLAFDVLGMLRERGIAFRVVRRIGPVVAIVALLSFGAYATAKRLQTYLADVPLGLPGTSFIRTPGSQAADLQWVTAQLASCGTSYSMPGMSSFTFWTGHALPSTQNVNNMLGFIQPEQQSQIIEQLSAKQDLCVVYSEELLRFFDRGQVRTDPPLLHYIQTRFTPVAQRHGYEILKRVAPAAP